MQILKILFAYMFIVQSLEPITDKAIVGKWQCVENQMITHDKVKTNPSNPLPVFHFKKDKTLTMVGDGKTYHGKWNITSNKRLSLVFDDLIDYKNQSGSIRFLKSKAEVLNIKKSLKKELDDRKLEGNGGVMTYVLKKMGQ